MLMTFDLMICDLTFCGHPCLVIYVHVCYSSKQCDVALGKDNLNCEPPVIWEAHKCLGVNYIKVYEASIIILIYYQWL